MYDVILRVHVPVALTCVVAFWIPVIAKKGGRVHVLIGRYFVAGMTFVALSGMSMGVLRMLDPSAQFAGAASEAALQRMRASGIFFLYLGTITLSPTLHGWRVVRTRKQPARIRSPLDIALVVLPILGSLMAIAAGLWMPGASRVLLWAMSPIGLVLGFVAADYVRAPTRYRMSWWYAHAGAMIGAGIATHTAFAIFVVSRWIAPDLRGFWQILPWILPSLLGVPAIFVVIRRAMRRFGDA